MTAASPSCSKGLQALRPFNLIAEIGGQVSMSCVLSYTAPLSFLYYEFLQAASGAFCLRGPCSCLDRLPRDPATTPDLDFPQQRAAVSKSSPCLAMQFTTRFFTWLPTLYYSPKVERWQHHAWGFVPCTAWIRERIIGSDSEAKLTEHSPSLVTSGSCSTLPSAVQDAGIYI